jgi:hypothetical protein
MQSSESPTAADIENSFLIGYSRLEILLDVFDERPEPNASRD